MLIYRSHIDIDRCVCEYDCRASKKYERNVVLNYGLHLLYNYTEQRRKTSEEVFCPFIIAFMCRH